MLEYRLTNSGCQYRINLKHKQELGEYNRLQVFNLLKKKTRSDIARILGITKSAISNILKRHSDEN